MTLSRSVLAGGLAYAVPQPARAASAIEPAANPQQDVAPWVEVVTELGYDRSAARLGSPRVGSIDNADPHGWGAIAAELNAELAAGSTQHRDARADVGAADWSEIVAGVNAENGLAPGANRPSGRPEADPGWAALAAEVAAEQSSTTR